MSALNRIRSMLQNNPEAKYGFVVYRCTYSNNAKWERFMQYLTAQAKSALEVEDATDLFEKLDWNVQEDSGLEGIGVAGVRSRFREWLAAKNEPNTVGPRGRFCVLVDAESLESVVDELDDLENKGKGMGQFDMWGVTWVRLVSKYWEGKGDGAEDEDEDEDENDDEISEGDEGEEKDDVSSTMVGISYLVPRAYELLDGPGWHSVADGSGGVATP